MQWMFYCDDDALKPGELGLNGHGDTESSSMIPLMRL